MQDLHLHGFLIRGFFAALRRASTALGFFVAGLFVADAQGQQSVTLNPGAAVTLAVTAEGTAPFTYQWRRDGVVLSGVSGDRYVISSFASTDAGTYTVVVANAAGSTTTDAATLMVGSTTLPALTSQPVSQSVTEGATVTFAVTATGSPAPTFRWRKDGVDLVDGGTVSGAGTATLKLSGVTLGQAGRYSVVATNSVGTALSGDAVLTVVALASAPVFIVQPTSRSVKEGSAVSFTAEASGNPAPAYRWHKDGVALNDGGNVSGAFTTKLSLASARSTDVGLYSLVATNSVGRATSSGAALTVATSTTQRTGGKGSSKTTTTTTTTTESTTSDGAGTALDGLNLFSDSVPAGFDVAGYLARYPKYKSRFGSDGLKAWLYYRDTGIYAGEVYDDLFRAEEYLALNPDVLATYGADLRAALLHWLNVGWAEGRAGRY